MKDSVQLVSELLKGSLTPTGEGVKPFFVTFYDGDPDLIPTFNLPALIVTKTSDTSEPATNVQDSITETLVVKAVLNKADDWNGDKADPTNLTEKKLRDQMEARDENGRWLPNTIKGALRKGLDGNRRIGERMSLEIGVTPRPNDLVTHEAHLTITIEYSVDVN